MSDNTLAEAQPQDDAVAPMGDSDYVPRQIIDDDLGGMSLDDAYAASMVAVEDGQLVTGTVVKVDRDEVLLDIGFKSEGVIPNKELSIRNEVDPSEIVAIGDEIEALVLQKEDKEGRLVLSKKRAQYERAWGAIEKIKDEEGMVSGPVIEVVKGGLIIDMGSAASCRRRSSNSAASVTCSRTSVGRSRRRSSSSTRTATTSCCPVGRGSRRRRRSSVRTSSRT